MKKLFLATASLVVLAGSAMAADMAVKARPIVAAAPACAQFGGLYLGGHVGWKYRDHKWTDKDSFSFHSFGTISASTGAESANGWEGGFQGGYNFQWNCAVWGVVADWSWTDIDVDNVYSLTAGVGQVHTHAYSSNEKSFGTLRTRSGIVVDNLLLYVTGGLAWAKFDRHHTYTNAIFLTTQAFDSSATRFGFAVGAGSEWALNANWSITSEFLYMGFEKQKVTYACTQGANPGFCDVGGVTPVGTPFSYDYKDSEWVARIGVNYRFGGYAPIVAKY